MRLREELVEAGVGGRQGRTMSTGAATQTAYTVGLLQQHFAASENKAIVVAADIHLSSPRTVRSYVRTAASGGDITPPDSSYRGRGNPDHPLHSSKSIPFEGEILMHRHLADVRQYDAYASSSTLQSALAEEFNITTSLSTVTRWLHSHGYSFRRKRFMGTLSESVKNQRMRAYVAGYARALREERAGTAVIVYTDESYIYSQHNKKMSWLPSSSLPDSADVRGNEKGGVRLIIIHAMTKDGMLEMPNADVSNDLTNVELSCEFVFQSVGINDDYHTAINGSKWVAWLNNRVIPTFKARYQGKKMILVLDNAKYHHARPADWISPATMSKVECSSFLTHHRIRSITTVRDGVEHHFADSTYLQRGRAAPTLVELKAAVAAHLAANPSLNTTLPQRAMAKEGYQLLYTPPYAPEVQPIELIWATVKHIVASQSRNNRSVTDARNQTELAFEHMKADACLARILHCQQHITAWLRTDGADELATYSDLDDLITHLPQSTSADSNLPVDVDASEVD